jgi:hypothetical protein
LLLRFCFPPKHFSNGNFLFDLIPPEFVVWVFHTPFSFTTEEAPSHHPHKDQAALLPKFLRT